MDKNIKYISIVKKWCSYLLLLLCLNLFFPLSINAGGAEWGTSYEQPIPSGTTSAPGLSLSTVGSSTINDSQNIKIVASPSGSNYTPRYYWQASAGSFIGDTDERAISWKPPIVSASTEHFVFCTLQDGKGHSVTEYVKVTVTHGSGSGSSDIVSPVVSNVRVPASSIKVGEPTTIYWTATDSQTADSQLIIALEYQDGSEFKNIRSDASNTGSLSWTPQKAASNMCVRVQATDAANNTSYWVLSNTFDVQGAAAVEMPAAAYLYGIGSETPNTYLDVKWRKIIDSNYHLNVDYYQLQYATNSSFSNYSMITHNDNSDPGNMYSTNTCRVSNLQDNSHYYFRVRGVNSVGSGPWSNIQDIRVNLEHLPVFDTSYQQPGHGAQGVSKTPVLRWRANDDDGDFLDYYVTVGMQPDQLYSVRAFKKVGYEGQNYFDFATEYSEPLRPNTTYYWQIQVKEDGRDRDYYGGEYIKSPVWSFKTVASGSDLAITNVALNSEVKPDSTVKFKVTVKNLGTEKAQSAHFKAAYIKNGQESPFRSYSGYLSTELNPGQEEIVDVEVVFRDSVTEYNGTTYDNVLVAGDSQVKLFFHWNDEQDVNWDNNEFLVPIHYEDAGGPVIDYFDIREHGSMYDDNGIPFWARMGKELIIVVNAHDDIKIARFVVQQRYHAADAWVTIHDQSNDSDTLHIDQPEPQYNTSNAFYWPVPTDIEPTSDAQLQVLLYDDQGNETRKTSESFSIFSNRIDASITPNNSIYKAGGKLQFNIDVDSDNNISVFNVTLYHGTSADSMFSQSNQAGIVLSNPYQWDIPDNNYYVSSNCYIQLSLTDDKGNDKTVRSAQFKIEPNTAIPAPFNEAVAIYNDEFSFPGDALYKEEWRNINFTKIDDNNIAHIILTHSYNYYQDTGSNYAEDILVDKVNTYYISYNPATKVVLSKIPVGRSGMTVKDLEITDGVPYILFEDPRYDALYISKKVGSSFTEPTAIESTTVPRLSGNPILKSSVSGYSDRVTGREKYVFLNGYLWELDIFTDRIYRRSFNNGVIGSRDYYTISNGENLESYGIKPITLGNTIYYIDTGSSKFVKLDTSARIVQSYNMPFSTSSINASYWNKCNAAMESVNGRIFVFGNGKAYEFTNNNFVERGPIAYTFNGERVDYSGSEWSSVDFTRVVNADGKLFLIMADRFYNSKPSGTTYEILEFDTTNYQFVKKVAETKSNSRFHSERIDGCNLEGNPDLLYIGNNKVLAVTADDIGLFSNLHIYRAVLKILDLSTGDVLFVDELPLKSSGNVSLVKDGGNIYVLAQNKDNANAESYQISLSNMTAAPNQVDEAMFLKHNGVLYASWVGGEPYDGTWNIGENKLNKYVKRKNKFISITPSVGQVSSITDEYLGYFLTTGPGHLSSGRGRVYSLNSDLTTNQLVYVGAYGNPCKFDAFGDSYVGVITSYNGEQGNFNAELLKNDYTVTNLTGLPQDCRFATYDNLLITGGYGSSGSSAIISKIDLATGQKFEVALGRVDSSAPFRCISMNANKYVAVGWDTYLAVADFSADIVAPTVTITNQETEIPNGTLFNLTWTATDNENQIDKFEVYKEVNGSRSQLATLNNGSFTYPYLVSENAAEIKFIVYAFDVHGNTGEASKVLPIITHTEDLTTFSLDKSAVPTGGSVTFAWSATGVDGTTLYTVSKRIAGTAEWAQYFQVAGAFTKEKTIDLTPGTYDFKIEAGADAITLTNALTVSGDVPTFDYAKVGTSHSGYYGEAAMVTLNWDLQAFPDKNQVVYDVYVNPNGAGYSKVETTPNYLFNYFISDGVTSLAWKIVANYQGGLYESNEQTCELKQLTSPAVTTAQLQDNNTDMPKVYMEFTPMAGISEYVVTRKAASGDYRELAVVNTGNYTDTTVAYGETYEYGVLSKMDELRGLKGAVLSIQVMAQNVNAVIILTENFILVEDTSLTVNFQPDADGAYEKYQVMFGTDKNALTPFTETTGRMVEFTNLDFDGTYYARVNALDPSGAVTASSDLFVFFTAPEPVELPVAPSQMQCLMASANGIELRWTDNSDNELGFMIERKEGPTGTYEQIHILDRTYHVDDNNIEPGKLYFYRVRAYNSEGFSPYCPETHIVAYALAVTTPNGGETWRLNETVTITWDSDDSGDVVIQLSRDNGVSWEPLFQSTPDDGSETWMVSGELSDECLIKVTEAGGNLSDTSDSVFAIQSDTGITVTSPQAGDVWQPNEERTITWTIDGTIDYVKIEFSSAGQGGTYSIEGDGIDSSTGFSWRVPDIDSSECVIRVSDANGDTVGYSGAFTIAPQASLTVDTPNGGEKWVTGTPVNITWSSQQVTGDISIQLYKNGSAYSAFSAVTVPVGDEQYTWNIPAGFTVGDDYTIGISKEISAQETVEDFSNATFSIVSANQPDFNNDGFADILLRNYTHGANQVWFMNGVTKSGSASLPKIANTNWRFQSTGDFNGDGKPDILLRESQTGANQVWFMDGVVKTGYAMLPSIPDTGWHIEAVADFNSDGKADILIRHHVYGTNQVWFMDGGAKTGSVMLPRIPDLNWQLDATGDFNGDGKPDILMRNYLHGTNQVWFMDGTTKTGGVMLPTIPDLNWRFDGVADFNGDGKPDILMRNYLHGTNQVWFMDGTAKTGGVMLPTIPDISWRIEN